LTFIIKKSEYLKYPRRARLKRIPVTSSVLGE